MKLVIDIPEEVKKTFDNASKADIYEILQRGENIGWYGWSEYLYF